MTVEITFNVLQIRIGRKRVLEARSSIEETIRIELKFTIINVNIKIMRHNCQSSTTIKFMKSTY